MFAALFLAPELFHFQVSREHPRGDGRSRAGHPSLPSRSTAEDFALVAESNRRSANKEEVLGALLPHCLPRLDLPRCDQFPELKSGDRTKSFTVLLVKPSLTV